MNHTGFSVEDFIWDEDFRQWVLFPDADADLFWNEWIAQYPSKEADVIAAKQIIKAIKIKNVPISDYEIQLAIANILNEIHPGESDLAEERHIKKSWNFWSEKKHLSIAASLTLVFSLIAFFYLKSGSSSSLAYNHLVKSLNENLVEKVNNGPGRLQINLQDGSRITLEKNARISLPGSFDGLPNRKVYLTGEAFFEVAKNPEKPFFVYANGLITKVLGTKFRIRSYDGEKNSVVEVSSGIVAVYSLIDKTSQDELNGQKLNSLILTRNQKANYSNEARTVMASVVEKPVAVNDKIFDYTFSDTPIKKIFENIREGYGIEIIYDEKLLGNRTFTADLSQTSMYDKLDIICKVINAHYEVIDGKIIIFPNGSNI